MYLHVLKETVRKENEDDADDRVQYDDRWTIQLIDNTIIYLGQVVNSKTKKADKYECNDGIFPARITLQQLIRLFTLFIETYLANDFVKFQDK